MKIKELQKTVNIAWSPAQLDSIHLAAGTAAQQIDVSINSQASLELYSINLGDPGYDMVLKGSQASSYRYVSNRRHATKENGLIDKWKILQIP